MNDAASVATQKQLSLIVYLLAGNLAALVIGAAALVVGLLPKLERVAQTTERVEARLQSLADTVEPVLQAGVGKSIQAIESMDTKKLSESATKAADGVIDAAGERAKRYLDKDKSKSK
jgi:hypothetical protein